MKRGNLAWVLWFGAIAVSFAVLETRGARGKGKTLSRFLWDLSEDWGPTEYLAGFVAGALATHLYWHWSPPGSRSQG